MRCTTSRDSCRSTVFRSTTTRVRADGASGTVVRFNYARHGEANGVVLDSGDFVHTRPDGFALLGFEIGMHVEADGESRALVGGAGRVIEARVVNGVPL